MCTVMEVRANQASLELCLVGRFLTNRAIRVHAVKERMAEPLKGFLLRNFNGVFICFSSTTNWICKGCSMEDLGLSIITCSFWVWFSLATTS